MRNKTFAGIEYKYASWETSKIILQSIPYDGTSTWGKGADKGFNAFMDAAENMELYDIEMDSEVYKEGIYLNRELSDFDSPEDMFNKTYQRAKELLTSNKFITFFGGEHSISIGIIKAYYEAIQNLTVLQIDAHADLRPTYEGTPYNHACALSDARKNCNLIQVGIRSMDISEKKNMDLQKVYFAHEIESKQDWVEKSIAQMSNNVYVTLDLDAFDSSIMPSTGTPEPGGLNWYTVTNYLRKVFQEKNVVGFDIVELAPIDGLSAPQYLTAKLYYKMLTYKFS
ncbi:MAG: agmatinase [Saprospiraceae bacterium]|nr:agmatinase [Bacteroidia bacterium]NNL93765.1 agmatinase [Saprospiraceae bacterium]